MSISSVLPGREISVRRGRRLEYFTLAWNSLEALASLISGFLAGSVALLSFGFDSLIEVASGSVLLWRLQADNDSQRRVRSERTALRLVGLTFLALSAYVAFDAAKTLWQREAPEKSLAGIIIAVASLIAMPLLARAKRRVARELGSGALHADSRQADFCTYLSAILLIGLVLNAWRGWWWADPAAALLMVPLIAKEGIKGLRGESCCDSC